MKTTLEHLHKELMSVKTDINLIKNILAEKGQLTEWAKKQLKEARKTPEKKYIHLEDV